MIISFNPQIFQTEDKDLQKVVARLLISVLDTNHFLDTSDIDTFFFKDGKFIFKENSIAKKFLSAHHTSNLEELIDSIVSKSGYITQLHKNHLSSIKIGVENDEIIPAEAVKIIDERSKVIVENGINDWKFIEGICAKYERHKLRGKIYQLINKAIKKEILEADNAGGVGEITKRANKWINGRYKDIHELKLMAVFDSDRISSADFTTHRDEIAFFKNKGKNTIQNSDYVYTDGDIIIWHILYKKKLENYLPLFVLFRESVGISNAQKTSLEAKTPDELDFIEYDNSNIGIGKGRIKQDFPNFFLTNFSYRELEARCEHHLVWSDETQSNISEIEQLLLKIAKII